MERLRCHKPNAGVSDEEAGSGVSESETLGTAEELDGGALARTYTFSDGPVSYDKGKQDNGWVNKRFLKPVFDKDGFRMDEWRIDGERRLLQF